MRLRVGGLHPQNHRPEFPESACVERCLSKKTTNSRDACGISRKRPYLKVAKASKPKEVDSTGEFGVVLRTPINKERLNPFSLLGGGWRRLSFSKPTLQFISVSRKSGMVFRDPSISVLRIGSCPADLRDNPAAAQR